MPRSMTSCPAGQSSRVSVLTTEDCRIGIAQSGIPIVQEATVCQILTRGASSSIIITQRAPGIWSLAASNTLTLNQITQGPGPGGTALHVLNHTVTSPLILTDFAVTTGGRVIQGQTQRCVTQTSHGLVVGDWIILDSATFDWTQAFDAGATIEDDAVAQVISVEDPNNFCYKPIGPFCQASGLTPGRTYFVETDGSGDLTLTEPGDTSVPRLFAVSSSEGILLPYRPLATSSTGTTEEIDIFDVDNTIVTNKEVTLSTTPLVGTEDVFVNGMLATPGGSRDYTITGSTITFNASCDFRIGDLITVKYES